MLKNFGGEDVDDLGLQEDVIIAWVRLTAILKNTRITQGMIYNEAVVMLLVNRRYEQDGEGVVAFRELVSETKMLKSLVNRTIDSLVKKGLLIRSDGADKRTTFVRPVPENLHRYLAVHRRTLDLVQQVVEVIGEEDARTFVRLADKIAASPLNS